MTRLMLYLTEIQTAVYFPYLLCMD